MNLINILIVAGTRPEAIKMAPLFMKLKEEPDVFDVRFCTTGQHKEMFDQVVSLFNISVDYDLKLMRPNQSLDGLTSRCLERFSTVLEEFDPHCVLVQGDTTTAMACALATFYKKIRIGHVEAGLRTHNNYSPFPEEVNRKIISQITHFHFAPTWSAVTALRQEGIVENVYLTGNTVIDALYWMADNRSNFPDNIAINGKKLFLVTAHRRESFGEPLKEVIHTIKEMIKRYQDIIIVYPIHKNPNIYNPVNEMLKNIPRIYLIDPVGYDVLVGLMKKSYLILTDSGGIQEEAPALGKPVLVLRNETERPEAVEFGNVVLVGQECDKILDYVDRLLNDDEYYEAMSRKVSPYGDGMASVRISQILKDNL
jgi:UDP-N-acetylglucosamine 2-epimerase (non-hydrolysing)